MTNYKMNFATKTLTITKTFAAMAMKPNTEEANTLAHLKSIFPDLKIAYKTYCSTGSHDLPENRNEFGMRYKDGH